MLAHWQSWVLTTNDGGGVTVAQFAHMLDSRQSELTYTDTGAGWKLLNEVKPLPIDQVMAVLRDAYGCDAGLTCDMIVAIDWLNAGASGHLLVVGFDRPGDECPPRLRIRHLDTFVGGA